MLNTTIKNRFLDACQKLLDSKPIPKKSRLQKVSYVGNFQGEVMTVTIERGDNLR
jgi:hypothetical protein